MRALLFLVLVGCNARLGGATFATGDDVDASGSSSTPIDAAPPIDAVAACANGRSIYLNFDGATLTRAATASDATQNKAVWLGVATATVAKFRPNAGDRTTQIDDTVTAFNTGIAGHPQIRVVTTRPAAGPYYEIGFGGSMTDVDVPYTGGVNRLDCGDTATKSDVAWVFESAVSPQGAANTALGALLFGLGATGTTSPSDCMCGWLTNCTSNATACTYSTSITAAAGCNTPNPVNEETFLDHFCD